MAYENIIYREVNEGDGVEVLINERLAGNYAVILKDVDSGNYLPTIKIYQTEEQAILAARKLIRGEKA